MRRVALLALLAACGRIGFASETGGDAPSGDARNPDTAGSSAPIAWEGSVVARDYSGASDMFPVVAHATGDVFVFYFSCIAAPEPPAATLTASGWTTKLLGPLIATPSGEFWTAAFTATAPDVTPSEFTLAWGGATCAGQSSELGDEFTNAGGVEGFVEAAGSGDCTATLVTGHADDAVWAACYSSQNLMGIGSGFTLASDDDDGDLSEYAVTADPADTSVTATFVNASNEYAIAALALTPR